MGLETITTDRKEEIAQSIGEILKELIKKGTAEMEAYFEDNTDNISPAESLLLLFFYYLFYRNQ